MEAEFGAWLALALAEWSLGEETYVQYIKDIVCMDSAVSDDQEKEDGIREFLEEVVVSSKL